MLHLLRTGTIQAKLRISQPRDANEQEADRMADHVMRMPESYSAKVHVSHSVPGVQRACACGGICDGCQVRKLPEDGTLQTKSAHGGFTGVRLAPPIVHQVLNSSGQPLDEATRAFMEPRFGRNFNDVRVHVGPQAATSAREVSARAYTVGRHLVFDQGQYAPDSRLGQQLLAHELAHVVQQGGAQEIPSQIPITDAHDPTETQAEDAANFASGAGIVGQRGPASLARFSDTGHHIVEEAGLAGAGFTEEEMKWIERGNVQRDYSQIPVGKVGNALLLCKPSTFGGYEPKEHFDNYLWDAVTGGWKTRGASAFGEKGVDIGKTPIDYISSQLEELANRGVNEGGLVHLGNAFHTVEDFFAHSNFVELIQGDTSHGATLMTGNPVGPSQSVTRIFEAITPRGISERYHEQSEEAIRSAAPGTHTVMAHDDPQAPNYTIARRLAALVVQDLGTDVLAVMSQPQNQRAQLMRERVVSKVMRYLRPPDPKDKWWETLVATDAGHIDRRLDEAARRTPTTVNQCAISPLKNLEASKDSPMALPVGVAIPVVVRGNTVWFQAGAGVMRPMPFTRDPGATNTERANPVAGFQVEGHF
ncbi:MAG TPA: DUF4157 domain-containing protein [Candidatus Sulfotelmatobacter sp.]|nr:DUF4157 domain-containing protein [Candidatus Sulfotelmatobacter sp.]